jgi:hypothetical protein
MLKNSSDPFVVRSNTYRSADDLGPFERAVGARFTGGRSLAVQLIVGVPFSLASDKQNVKYEVCMVGSI